MGPKLWVERFMTPRLESRLNVKPEAGEGMGIAESWLAREMLNWVNSVWKALLKWPEWFDCEPSGFVTRARLLTLRPSGPYRLGMRNASFWFVWARAGTAVTRIPNASKRASFRLIKASIKRNPSLRVSSPPRSSASTFC